MAKEIHDVNVNSTTKSNRKNSPWWKNKHVQYGMIAGACALVVAGGAGIAIAVNQPAPVEQNTQEEQSATSESLSKTTSDSGASEVDSTDNNAGADSIDNASQQSDTNSNNNQDDDESILDDETKQSVQKSTQALLPSFTAESANNKSYTEKDGDYIKVDDFWKYRNIGDTTEFVRLSDNFSFTVDTKMSPTYTLDPHYKPNLEFATNENQPLHFSINVHNNWEDTIDTVESKKEYIASNDGHNKSYTIGDFTVMYSYSAKAATNSFYTSNYIYVWNEANQFFMTIYCDNYNGEEDARAYTDLFHF